MKLLLLPFLVATVFGYGQDATSIFFGRVNNGVVREPVSDETSPLFAGPLAGHEALADCPDFQMIDLMSRGADFTVTIDCNGEMKWALYESTSISRQDDLDEAPVYNANMTGGFSPADMWEDKLYPWFEPLKEDGCKVEYSRCGFRFLQLTMQYTCPLVCEDGETHPLYSMALDPSHSILKSIDDEAQMSGTGKLCTMKMKTMLSEAGVNTRVILDDAGLTSDIVDLDVVTGSYLELLTGTQYCMKVSDEASGNAEAVISLYQFNLEGTKPFMVSLPFDDMMSCEYFLKKVSCQWASTGNCVYDL